MRVEGVLQTDDRKIDVITEFASRYSLFINCKEMKCITDGTEFKGLALKIEDEEVDLGQCRLLIEPNIDGYAGRLVFKKSVYDLESLFGRGKLVKLQSSFINLPLVLSHKKEIDADFRNFTADLAYDLSVYKSFFDTADLDYAREPEHIKRSIQDALLATEGRNMIKYLNEKIVELGDVVRNFDRKAHERHGFYLRKQIWNYLICSPFIARANLKPRGYAGDSKMMSMIYANEYLGDSTFGKIMHKHPLEHPTATAVRNRRSMIANRISELSKNMARDSGPIRVLSVACGPAYEVQDIITSPEDGMRYHYVLFDQDRRALKEAAENIVNREKALNIQLTVDYINESVRTMLANPNLEERLGQFNFVYSMGLFDYLTPPVAKAVIEKLFNLLTSDGTLIVGNYFVANPGRFYMEYWLDWVLYHRTEEEFRQLLEAEKAAQIDIIFEDTRSQMFLCAKKRV